MQFFDVAMFIYYVVIFCTVLANCLQKDMLVILLYQVLTVKNNVKFLRLQRHRPQLLLKVVSCCLLVLAQGLRLN
jgi:hypothetical protein